MILSIILTNYIFLKTNQSRYHILDLIYSITINSLVLFISTEVLSIFKLLTNINIIIFWCIINLSLIIYIFSKKYSIKNDIISFTTNFIKSKFNISLFLFFTIVFLIAVLTVPYNWDSLRYHLTRVLFWVNNKSVNHFRTNDVRQLTSPIIHEYILTNIYLLYKSDILFNTVQNFAFIISSILIYNLTYILTNNKLASKISTIIFISIPIVFAESLSTQTDLLATMYMLMYIYLCLYYYKENTISNNNKDIFNFFIMGSLTGLTYLTKPHTLFSISMFSLFLFIHFLKNKLSLKKLFVPILIIFAMFSLLIFPSYIRNYITFGSISHYETGAKQLIETLNPLYILMNFIKNLSFNLPNYMVKGSSRFICIAVNIISKILKVNLDDPSISEHGIKYLTHNEWNLGQDTALNSNIFILTIISAIVYFIYRNKIKFNYYIISSLLSITMFLSFVKWEQFITRYEISIISLMPSFSIYIIYRIFKDKKQLIIIYSMIIFIFITNLLSIFCYHTKIMLNNYKRPDGYFYNIKNEVTYYNDLFNLINNDSQINYIGLYIKTGDPIDYTILKYLKDKKIQYTLVPNSSYKYESDYNYDAIIVINKDFDKTNLSYDNKNYNRVYYEYNKINLFIKDNK